MENCLRICLAIGATVCAQSGVPIGEGVATLLPPGQFGESTRRTQA